MFSKSSLQRLSDAPFGPRPWRVEIVKRSQTKGWELLPKRWIVERTLAWLGRWRGLAREYDYLPETTEAKILLAMSRLMLRRLTA